MRKADHSQSSSLYPHRVLTVHGAEHVSNQRLHTQAVREEVESRIAEMLAAAESTAATNRVGKGSALGPTSSTSTSQQHVDSANLASPVRLPLLPSSRSQLQTALSGEMEGSVVRRSPKPRAGLGGSGSSLNVNETIFSVSGQPTTILRHLIKHFLCNPKSYGTHVRQLLEEELRFVLSIWASSSTDPTEADNGELIANVVKDNFFERILKSDVAKSKSDSKRAAAASILEGGDGDSRGLLLELLAASGGTHADEANIASSLIPSPPSIGAGVTNNGRQQLQRVPNGGEAANVTDDAAARAASPLSDSGASGRSFEVTTLRRKIKALEQSNIVLQDQLATKTMEVKDLDAELRDARQQMEEAEVTVIEHKKQKEVLERELTELRRSLDDQLLKVNNYRDEEADKQRTLELRLKELKTELGQVYSQWKTSQNQVAAAQKELDRSIEESEKLHDDLELALKRVEKGKRIVVRRNKTISLMQELLNRRREAHQYVQQCVRELEVFAGAGTLTELYIASDPCWSAFLFYRLHRQVHHVTPVALAPPPTPLHLVHQQTPLFIGNSEGGSWAISGFSAEHLLRLVLSNNGEYEVTFSEHKKKSGGTGLIIVNNGGGGGSPKSHDLDASPSHRKLFTTGIGACSTLRWATSPFSISFASKKLSASNHHAPSVDENAASSYNSSMHPVDNTTKCHPVLCIESLLLPPTPNVARRLNVTANIIAAARKRALTDGDTVAAETMAAMEGPPYQAQCESTDDTLKLRRSDVRLILYSMWKERYKEYMNHFTGRFMRSNQGAASSHPLASAALPTAATPAAPPVKPLSSFITFLYSYLSQRFPLTAGTGPNNAAPSPHSQYRQPLDAESLVVRPAIGDDRVAYCFLRSKPLSNSSSSSPRLPAKYVDPQQATKPADSLIALSPLAREVLSTLIMYSHEYKEVDADFRLFYLVSHQLLPEAVAINFISMTEAIYRDCDAAVLSVTAVHTNNNNSSASPHKQRITVAALSTSINSGGDVPLLSPPSTSVGALRELYQEVPVTRIEMKSVDASCTAKMMSFDNPSSSEDDETAIVEDGSCASNAVQTYLAKKHAEGSSATTSSPGLSSAPGPRLSTSGSLGRSPAGAGVRRLSPAAFTSPNIPIGSLERSSAAVTKHMQHSELLQRNGLISLHEFIRVLELHCFAAYSLVRETAPPLDWIIGHSSSGSTSGGNSPPGGLQAQLQMLRDDLDSDDDDDESNSDGEDDVFKAYRRAAKKRMTWETSAEKHPLDRVGYVPLTALQAQRLKFALSLDQPSSVIKYATLFRPDNGAARPSHFYDELLTMTMDYHLAVQEVLMDELVLPSCTCRHGSSSPSKAAAAAAAAGFPPRGREWSVSVPPLSGEESDPLSHSQRSSAASVRSEEMDRRRSECCSSISIGPATEDCEGEISVEYLLEYSKRWLLSIDQAAASQSASPSIFPNDQTLDRSKRTLNFDPEAVESAARCFVLQLAEACPKDNTSGQFSDAVVTVTSPAMTAKSRRHPDDRDQQISIALEHFSTLPLQHVAMKIRTSFIIFEHETLLATDDPHSVGKGIAVTLHTRRQSKIIDNRRTSLRAVQAVVSSSFSKLAFRPPSKEASALFQEEMESLCVESDMRIASQRALFNKIVSVLPLPPQTDTLDSSTAKGHAFSASVKKAKLTNVVRAAVDANAGGNASNRTRPVVGFAEATSASLAPSSLHGGDDMSSSSPSDRKSFSVDNSVGGSNTVTVPTFRNLYQDGLGLTTEQPKAGGGGGVGGRKKSVALGGKKKSISDAIGSLFEASRAVLALEQSLPQIQETAALPLELGLATMLKRQLAPKFPPQLLPGLGDLQHYHKALMEALLKPIDDVTLSKAETVNINRLPSTQPGSPILPLPGEHHGEGDPLMTKRRSQLSRASSFALLLAKVDPTKNGSEKTTSSEKRQQQVDGTADPSTPQTPQAKQSVAKGVHEFGRRSISIAPTMIEEAASVPQSRRRLGSIAMSLHSNIT